MAVLYAQLGTPEFTTLHDTLATVAREGRVQYVFRHYVKVLHVQLSELWTCKRVLLLVCLLEPLQGEDPSVWLWSRAGGEEHGVQGCG